MASVGKSNSPASTCSTVSPGLLRIQAQPPTPFARTLLYGLLTLLGLLFIWAILEYLLSPVMGAFQEAARER